MAQRCKQSGSNGQQIRRKTGLMQHGDDQRVTSCTKRGLEFMSLAGRKEPSSCSAASAPGRYATDMCGRAGCVHSSVSPVGFWMCQCGWGSSIAWLLTLHQADKQARGDLLMRNSPSVNFSGSLAG